MNNEQLIKLVISAQEGNSEALNQLFDTYYNDLYYFALKTVKDSDLASDITQEAFIDIIKNINTLKEPAAFVSWAKKITYFQCTRYFKKKKDILVDEDENGNTVFDNLKEENSEFIPDEALDKDDFKKTIMSIIDELPEEQRATVMMYYFDELSVKQIAEIQGVSEGTVKSRLNYARKAIKSAVEEYEKKNDIKLHSFALFPFLRFIFSQEKSTANIAKPDFKKLLSLSKDGRAAVGARLAKNGLKKSVGTKVAAAVAAALLGTGAILGIIAVKNGIDPGKTESQPSTQNEVETESETKTETADTRAYKSFSNLRDETAKYVKATAPYETVDETSSNSAGFNYKLPAELYNILSYDQKYILDDSYIFTREDFYVDEIIGIKLYYEIPCQDESRAEEMIKKDVNRTNQFMKSVFNGNEIGPDYAPEFSQYEYKNTCSGAHMLLSNYYEYVGSGLSSHSRNSIQFQFVCKEKDGKLYYCPSVFIEFSEIEGDGSWNAVARTGLSWIE